MEQESEKRYPTDPKDYKLYEEVGEGVSANVYRALCIPFNEIVAIKVLDLEKCNNDLDGIRREVQTMRLIDHPNVLRAYCAFTADHSLWVVMPYMAGGSCLHIMKSSYPEGFEEPIIATILRDVLKALVYLHGHGHIHRDVKAGNILIDSNGAVKLADFGVSACMFDTGDRQRSRNTFVGTPCWMAPEVMQQLHGYDFKADIWSFGITALELAHGHAPFSKYPPMKVLLMTLQNAPPGLDYERDKKFSKSFKEMVSACLVKDPKKRPTSEKLWKHPFFKRARSNEFLGRTILDGLPPLGDRFRTLKGEEANFLIQNNPISGDKEQMSQQEYIRGISAWNFNIEDLKAQAALIQNTEDVFESEDTNNDHMPKVADDGVDFPPQSLSPERIDQPSSSTSREDDQNDLSDLDGAFASAFPTCPLQALKTCFDVSEDAIDATSHDSKGSTVSDSEPVVPLHLLSLMEDLGRSKCNGENLGRSSSVPQNIHVLGGQKFSSGSLLPEHVLSPYKHITGDVERDQRNQHERNPSGPLLHRQIREPHGLVSATIHEESTEGRVLQLKGRFKVTSADAGSKVALSTNCIGNPIGGAPTTPRVHTASILPSLQFLLQQNSVQREQLIKLIKCVDQSSGCQEGLSDVQSNDLPQRSQVSFREKELQAHMVRLQQSVGKLSEEVQRLKFQNTLMEREISNLCKKGTVKERVAQE